MLYDQQASLKHLVSEGDTEIIRQIYSRINQGDIDSAVNLMDEDITRVEFEGFPLAGTYRGKAELRQHLIAGRSTWAEGACTPIEFFAAADKIVVIVQINVKLKNNPAWINEQIADGFMIKNHRVTEFHSFTNNEKAFEWAGITT